MSTRLLGQTRRGILLSGGAALTYALLPAPARGALPLLGLGRGLVTVGRAVLKYGGPVVAAGMQLYDWLTESEASAAGWSVHASFLNPEINVTIPTSVQVVGNTFASHATAYVDTVHEAQREIVRVRNEMGAVERKMARADALAEKGATTNDKALAKAAGDISALRQDVQEYGPRLVALGGRLEQQETALSRHARTLARELGDIRSSLEWERVVRELDWELDGKLEGTRGVAAIQNRTRFPATVSGRVLAKRLDTDPAESRWIPLTRTLAPHTSETLSLRDEWALESFRVTSIGGPGGGQEQLVYTTVSAEKAGVAAAFSIRGTSPDTLHIGTYRNRPW
jgi:hypothetical protein